MTSDCRSGADDRWTEAWRLLRRRGLVLELSVQVSLMRGALRRFRLYLENVNRKDANNAMCRSNGEPIFVQDL